MEGRAQGKKNGGIKVNKKLRQMKEQYQQGKRYEMKRAHSKDRKEGGKKKEAIQSST